MDKVFALSWTTLPSAATATTEEATTAEQLTEQIL